MDIDTMPAGREMDALVAEKVMGIRILSLKEMKAEAERVWREQPSCIYFLMGFRAERQGETVRFYQQFSPYSIDIAAAMNEVVEEIKSELPLPMVTIHWDNGDTRPYGESAWECEIYRFDGDNKRISMGKASAPTAPLAICRAALKAKMEGAGGVS